MAIQRMDFTSQGEDYDSKGRVKTSLILHHFQDVAEKQIEALGEGPDLLREKGHMWVILKLKLRFIKAMEPGEGLYTCSTCPVGKKRATYKRNYAIEDRDTGERMVIGGSNWCMLNLMTRSIDREETALPDDVNEVDEHNWKFEKFRAVDPVKKMDYTVGDGDIDYNMHTNNCRYVELTEEVTGRNPEEEFYIVFNKETRIGDTISIYTEDQEEWTYVEGRLRDSGDMVFQVRFK